MEFYVYGDQFYAQFVLKFKDNDINHISLDDSPNNITSTMLM